MPRPALLCVLSITAALCCGGEALACRFYQSPEDRVMRAYDAIILARIESAAYQKDIGDLGQSWRATARRTAGVAGMRVDQKTFEIGRTGQSTACDDGQPIAKVGETWALYLSKRPEGGYRVGASYPLAMAREIDSRLR
jgi:hypothetical protein